MARGREIVLSVCVVAFGEIAERTRPPELLTCPIRPSVWQRTGIEDRVLNQSFLSCFISTHSNRMSFPQVDAISCVARIFKGVIQHALRLATGSVVPWRWLFYRSVIMSDHLQGITFDPELPACTLGSNRTGRTILSISRDEQDHSSLQTIFSQWEVLRAMDLAAARTVLREKNISVVVCDCDSIPEQWTEILDHVQQMPVAPSMILTSRLADDRFWSQALHLGAWDVLAKPFKTAEVVRTLRYAWEHWRNRNSVLPAAKALSACG